MYLISVKMIGYFFSAFSHLEAVLDKCRYRSFLWSPCIVWVPRDALPAKWQNKWRYVCVIMCTIAREFSCTCYHTLIFFLRVGDSHVVQSSAPYVDTPIVGNQVHLFSLFMYTVCIAHTVTNSWQHGNESEYTYFLFSHLFKYILKFPFLQFYNFLTF